jgi:hypothetical protein
MRKSRFKDRIRIDPKQKEWINTHKGTYTLAGKLDEIINFYKQYEDRSVEKQNYKR